MKTRISSTARTKSRGFSLIEMSIVITLIALFAAFILPNLVNSRQSERERLFHYGMKRLADNARETAISRNATLHLSIDQNRMTVTNETDTKQKGDEIMGIDIVDGASPTKFQANGQDMSAGDWDIRFFPDGTADEGGVEFTLGQDTEALNITPRGATSVDEKLTNPADIRWEAGTYETR